MADTPEVMQPDNSPAQIQTPAQFPTATRIENGIAYDISGKALGQVPDQQEQDPWAVVSHSPAQAQPAQEKDPWAVVSTTPGEKQSPTLWEAANKPVGKDVNVKYQQINQKVTDWLAKHEPEKLPEWMKQVSIMTSRAPLDIGGAIVEAGRRMLSPLGVATLGLGSEAQAAKQAPGVAPLVKKGIQLAETVAASAFSGQGVKEALTPRQEGESGLEEFERRVSGVGQALFGTPGVVHGGSELLRGHSEALVSAKQIHDNTKQVFNSRTQEVDTATKQADIATQQAEIARHNEADGTGTRQQTIDAENNASAATANAKKAQSALKDAGETRAQAGMDVDRLQRKVARAQAKANDKQTLEHAGAKEDFQKAIPPSAKGPAAYTEKDYQVGRGYLEQHHQNIQEVTSPQDTYDAFDHIQHDMENKVRPYVEKYGQEPNPRNVKMDVRDQLAENPRADFVEKGMRELEAYNLTDPSIAESDEIRANLNAQNRATLAKNMWDISTALQVDPEFAARYHAAESLRNGEYDLFEDKNVNGIREMRQDEASIIKLRNAAQKQMTKGESRVRGSGESGAIRKTAAWALQKGATILGAKTFGPLGAAAAESTHPAIGRAIAPGDLTRSELIQRSMKVRGAGVPVTQIEGVGMPSNPPSFALPPTPSSAMTPQDMLQVSRENSPLHSELATHYGVFSGDESYADLEQRFKEDIADKQKHGVALEASEKKLLSAMNQQNSSETLAAQQAAQQEALSGKTIGKFNLPDNVEPVMHIQGDKMPNGMTTPEGLVHDLAHIVVGNERNISFPDGIRSHLHPENGGGRLMSAPLDWDEFHDDEGNIDFNKIKTRMSDIATTYVAGGVANDLYHGVPFTENHGLGADMKVLKQFLKKTGFTEAEASKMIAQAADDAAVILNRPGTREILEGHAAVREAGLDTTHHFSPERIEQVLQDLKEGTKRETTTGKSSGANGEGNKPASESGAGTETKSKAGDREGVRKESEAGAEGKEGRAGKSTAVATAERPGASESDNPALSEQPDITHRATEKGGEVRMDTEQEGLLKNRGLLKYTMEGKEARVTAANLDKDFRGQGLGTEMYERAAQEAKAKGATALTSDLGGQTSMDAAKVWDRLSDKYPGEIEKFANKTGSPGYRWNLAPETLNPALSAPAVPGERTTGVPEHDNAIKQGGAVPGGIMRGDPSIGLSELTMFHDPKTGTTLALKTDGGITAEKVAQKIAASRAEYKAAETKTANDPFEKAAKHYGVTDDINKAGYIGPDGRMLDFSDGQKARVLDHGDIATVTGDAGAPRQNFVADTGALRVLKSRDYIGVQFDADKPPTTAQLRQLEPWLKDNPKFEFEVSSRSGEGKTAGSAMDRPESLDDMRQMVKDARLDATRRARGLERSNIAKDAAEGADDYNKERGLPPVDASVKPHDPEFAKRVADAFDAMKHDPTNPEVQKAYGAMADEVKKQWDYATQKMGMKFEPWTKDGQPYANSKEMMNDVADNKHLYFFQGGDLKEGSPMAQANPETGLTYNDMFRAVHDLFGHAATGFEFGPKGEENAYLAHRQMFPAEAVPALTSETRGQNSWVNFGKHLRDAEGNVPKKGEEGYVPQTERPYAEQKVGLLPSELQGTGEVLKPEDLEKSNVVKSPKGSSVPLMENPLPVKGTMEGGEVGTLDLTKALNKFSRKELPALEPGSEPKEMVDRARKLAADETKYQLAQSKTGTEWYTTEMKDHDKVLQDLRPELAEGETTAGTNGHPVNLTLFKAAEAILSSGQKPYANVKSALKAWDAYKETGQFPPTNPAPGKEGLSWGPRNVAAYGNALNNLNRLIAEKGEKGAADWLLSEHPVSELKQYNKEGVSGKKDDQATGAMILGEKRGPFMQNLHGIESKFTADMWVSRTWNRWMGTLDLDPRIEDKGKMTSESDTPRNNTERALMKESFEKTANKLGLTTSSLQAVLWYYEQGLYRAHGLPVESWSFSDAANRVAKEAKAVPEAEQTGFNFGANKTEGGPAALSGKTKNPNAVSAFDFINALKKK